MATNNFPKVLPKDEWPKILQHTIVQGVSIGCVKWWDAVCTDHFKEPSKTYAHAHCHPDDPCVNCICFRSEKEIKSRSTCYHELAHLVVNDVGAVHGVKWFETLISLPTNPYDKLLIWIHLWGRSNMETYFRAILSFLLKELLLLGLVYILQPSGTLICLFTAFVAWTIVKSVKNIIASEYYNVNA